MRPSNDLISELLLIGDSSQNGDCRLISFLS